MNGSHDDQLPVSNATDKFSKVQNTFHLKNDLPSYLQNNLSTFRPQPLPQRSQNVVPQNQSSLSLPGSQPISSPQVEPLQQSNQNIKKESLDKPFKATSLRRKRKTCKKCGLDITGQFVRALSSSFHIECFCCNECGKQCSSKFFPYEVTDPATLLRFQVALCEYDYFKKLDLICFNCNNALRGPYITALGNKYHLEHFKCKICQKVFESDESYYEHDANIYCHYHYSKEFANNCEGCNSSIVKQFVELFRGGRNQQWHPECYMVYKFWSTTITKDLMGVETDPEDLAHSEQLLESLVVKIWLTLSTFEELTASCISDMLLNACIGNQTNGLKSTGKLIMSIEVLFNAIDFLITLSVEAGESDQFTLNKEPRNLSGKIMSYLAILRKSSQINSNGSLSSELLSVITGSAHYLKLLIRIALQNSLRLNKVRKDSEAVDNFLGRIKKFDKSMIPVDSTDLCKSCGRSIEKACVKVGENRFHTECKEEGEKVSDLQQLLYLLKIAYLRSCQVMTSYLNPNEDTANQTLHYSNTLKDVTRLRSKREEQPLSSIKKDARKSVIIEPPSGENAQKDDINDVSNEETEGLSLEKNVVIKDERRITSQLNRTSDLLKNEKSLTLDDIPRIVAAEQARDQRPNAFKHHNSLYQRQKTTQLSPIQSSPSSTYIPEKKNKYYSELGKSEHFVMRHIAVEALTQLLGSNKSELLNAIQTKKSTFWDRFKFGHTNEVSGVFNVNLEDLVKKYGVDSELGVGPEKLRIPIVIDDLVNSLKTKDMSVEGIFRLNGNIKKLKQLTNDINNNPLQSPDFTNQTAVQLAALMKKWLRDLPDPLLTFKLYNLWIETQKQTDLVLRKRLLRLVYCMLPRPNRNLTEVLLNFFKWASSFAEIDEENGSKMDIHNIATVISPNILYGKEGNDASINARGESYFLAIEVVNQMIEIHEDLSIIPQDLQDCFDKCFRDGADMSAKEVMNKIEKFSKESPNFFVNYQMEDEYSDPLNHEVRSNTITRGLSKAVEYQGETLA